MASKRAIERASYILQMSEADEAQRNIRPLPLSERELAAKHLRELHRNARSFEWRYEKLPRLMSAWQEASVRNLVNPEAKALLIRATIAARHSKVVWPESEERSQWTEISGRCRSTMMTLFTRLTNAARGVSRNRLSQTAN